MENTNASMSYDYVHQVVETIEQTADLGVDGKGRKIGGYAEIKLENRSSLSGYENGEFVCRYGAPCYALRIFSTRNGETFGAYPKRSVFDTPEQASAAAKAKLAQQAKRRARS